MSESFSGIHYGLEDAKYRAVSAVSNSMLTRFAAATPKHFKEGPEFKVTAEIELGLAIHSGYLTPSLFSQEYVQGQNVDRRTKDGKKAHELFLAINEGRRVVPYYDYERCLAVVNELAVHKEVRRLTEKCEPEVSIFWEDNLSILSCKGRIDLYDQTNARLFDLKTTSKSASEKEFTKTVLHRGYHRQAAFYLDGLKEIGAEAKDFYFIVAETEAPYAIALYKMDNEFIELGRREIRGLLQQYAICARSNFWPSYPAEVQVLRCPPWLKNGDSKQITQLEEY